MLFFKENTPKVLDRPGQIPLTARHRTRRDRSQTNTCAQLGNRRTHVAYASHLFHARVSVQLHKRIRSGRERVRLHKLPGDLARSPQLGCAQFVFIGNALVAKQG